jgi:EmrB/QacA subfamily drug resistance transporter
VTRPAAPGKAAWRVLLIGLGTLIVPLDTAVNIAFPQITRAFDLSIPMIQWIILCYVLTYGSLMLAVGRIGDMFGHRAVFRFGLLWSAVAFLLCAQAPSYGWLLLCRVLQGVGAALVISCGPALVTSLYPEAMRGRVLGIYTLMFAMGSALGPSLGGILIEVWGWEAVFWFRAPIALAALLLLARGLPAPPRAAAREPYDAIGAALLTLAISTALLAVNQARHVAAGEHGALALAVLSIAGAAAFVRRTLRSPRPIIDLRLFRAIDFSLVNLANVLVNLAAFAVLLFVPYYLARISGLPASLAGLVLAAGPIGTMLASPLGGRALAWVPPQRLALFGTALVGGGLFLIGGWGHGTGASWMVLGLLVQGAGLGLFQVSYTDIVTGTMPRQDRGVAGSLAMMTRTLGVVTAASLLTVLFQRAEASALAAGVLPADGFLDAFGLTFRLAAAIPAAVLAIALLRAWRSRRPVS